MAYKMDNLRYGAMDDSYIDSMAEAHDNSQDAVRWKLLVDQSMKDDSLHSTNEGDAYRQKELLAVRAKKKKIIQEIDALKKELQQRTQLQAFEDKYKDSPFWRLAKKNYIDTGDMGAIESFITRENALQEAMTNREFTGRENELNRQNTLELNKAQKAEQAEYNYNEAIKELDTAKWILNYNMTHDPAEVPEAKANYEASLKKVNDIGKKINKAEIESIDLNALENYDEWAENHDVNKLSNIYSFENKDEKDKSIALANELKRKASKDDKNYYDSLIERFEKIVPDKIAVAKKAQVKDDTTQKVNAYNDALANYLKYYVQMSDIADPAINKNGYNADEATLLNVKNNMTRAYNALPESLTDKALKKTPDGKNYYDKIRAEGGK